MKDKMMAGRDFMEKRKRNHEAIFEEDLEIKK